MDQRTYQAELANALAALQPLADRASIAGEGVAQFLSVERAARGIELYRDADRVLIDRSIDGRLLGEQSFPSLVAALEAAAQWLRATESCA
jgi:hypothetical protein